MIILKCYNYFVIFYILGLLSHPSMHKYPSPRISLNEHIIWYNPIFSCNFYLFLSVSLFAFFHTQRFVKYSFKITLTSTARSKMCLSWFEKSWKDGLKNGAFKVELCMCELDLKCLEVFWRPSFVTVYSVRKYNKNEIAQMVPTIQICLQDKCVLILCYIFETYRCFNYIWGVGKSFESIFCSRLQC